MTNVVAIAAGWNHSLALENDGTAVIWGDYTFSQTNAPAYLTNIVAIVAWDNRKLTCFSIHSRDSIESRKTFRESIFPR